MKFLLNVVGSLALGLAILGLFLPLLPTTPFLLLASACYMRGSERMHRWMMNNRLFGEQLRNYQERQAIPRRTKIFAISLTWISLGISAAAIGTPGLQLLLLGIGCVVTFFILRIATLE